MSDLVEQLRKEIKFSLPRNTVHIDLLGEAAARIETLEAALQKFDTIAERYWERRCRDEYDENATFRARIEALEAALRDIAGIAGASKDHLAWMGIIEKNARAALAPEQDK